MKPPLHPFLIASLLRSVLVSLFLFGIASATDEITFTFDNTDLQTVIKTVGARTQTTFLFDPEQVKGKLTLVSPQRVSPAAALQLLQSALALHGYTMLSKEEGTWIVPAAKVRERETAVEVVPLNYARAEEVAYALQQVMPSGVRIVPYYPTNSLIISGDPRAVKEIGAVLKEGRETKEK